MILPRLAELAQGGELTADAGDTLVVLAPGVRRHASTEAAEAVARVLGASPDEGRLRLAVTYPEPLVQLEQEAASDALRALREAGVEAFDVPTAEVAQAPAAFEVERVEEDDDGWVFRDREGAVRHLGREAPRFVAQGQRLTLKEDGRRRSEPVALVFQLGGSPLLLSPFSLRSGPVGKTPPQRLAELVAELLEPPGRGATIPGCSAPALLAPDGEGTRSNGRSLALAARLLRWQVEQDSLG
ncbi:MAG: hypothetical protein R3F62_15625 [Planctomycetota bacterium]